MPPDHDWCPECNCVKRIDEFPRNKSQKKGRGTYCKPCHNRITRKNRADHGGARNYHLRRRYGITAEHAEQMLAEQNGLCAICIEAPAVHVDHDHETGRVRGLLCFNCNGALGQFRDRADLMPRAALYLTSGAQAVADFGLLEFAFSAAPRESPRPEGVTDADLAELRADVRAEYEAADHVAAQ